ncbi:MAG: ATP-binding cassette domain-containing protein, partial [bacterium]
MEVHENILTVQSLSKVYQNNSITLEVLKNISFDVRKGEFVAIVGSSGCGKTTLLRCLAGLISFTKGKIIFNGEALQADVGMIFQEFSAFPWLTVRKNIELGLEFKKIPQQERRPIIDHYLAVTGLKEYADFYPKSLSGGMKQRVAI